MKATYVSWKLINSNYRFFVNVIGLLKNAPFYVYNFKKLALGEKYIVLRFLQNIISYKYMYII